MEWTDTVTLIYWVRCTRMSPFWIFLELMMMEVMTTTGDISALDVLRRCAAQIYILLTYYKMRRAQAKSSTTV